MNYFVFTGNLLVLAYFYVYFVGQFLDFNYFLRTISVISSPLSHSKGTSDTLFFLVECTSCNIPLNSCVFTTLE